MNPTHLTRQELYEELGKAQSRDSSTTNKKLRKEIEELKENVERLEGVNKTIAQERERYKQRMCELEAENELLKETIRVFAEMCQDYNQTRADNRDVLRGKCSTTVESWIEDKMSEARERLQNRKDKG
jgi:chromosome segregation ATPase